MKGISYPKIAKILKGSKGTVYNYIKSIKKHKRETANKAI